MKTDSFLNMLKSYLKVQTLFSLSPYTAFGYDVKSSQTRTSVKNLFLVHKETWSLAFPATDGVKFRDQSPSYIISYFANI